MSRLYLALFWLSGLITLAAAIEYQVAVNQFANSVRGNNHASRPNGEGADDVNKGQNIAPASTKKAMSENDATGAHSQANDGSTTSTDDPQVIMARWTRVGSIATVITAVFLIWTLIETRRQANALVQANKDSRDTHNAERRPWLSLEIHVEPNGLVRQPDNATTCFMVYAKVKNCGATPASGVVFFPRVGLLGTVEEFLAAMKSFCDPIRKAPRIAQIIFPEEERVLEHPVCITDAEVSDRFAKKPDAVGQAVLYGCVQYQSQYTATPRQTRFVYHVCRTTPEGKQTFLVDKVDQWYRHQIFVLPDVVWKDAD